MEELKSNSPLASRRGPAFAIALAVITVAAGGLRFWNLRERGLFYFDEAMFVANGRYFGTLLRLALTNLLYGKGMSNALLARAHALWLAGGSPWMHARPLHEGLIIGAAFLCGDNPAIYLFLSAVAGTASVLLISLIPDRRRPGQGILAAALLSFSVWHLHYSRSALSQGISVLTVIIVMLIAASEKKRNQPRSTRNLFGLSIATGLAFLSHYNLFWLPPLVWCWLAWDEWKGRQSDSSRVFSWFSWLWRLAGSGLAMASVPLFVQLFSVAGISLAKRGVTTSSGILAQLQSYFAQIHVQIFYWSDLPQEPTPALYFPRVLFTLESPWVASLLVIGVLALAVESLRGNRQALLWLLMVLVPTAIWLNFPYPNVRSFVPALPAMCVGGAMALDAAVVAVVKAVSRLVHQGQGAEAGWRWEGVLQWILIAAVVAMQMPRLVKVAAAVSPWQVAASRLIEYRKIHGGVLADNDLCGGYPHGILRYYLGSDLDRSGAAGNLFLWDVTTRYPKWSRNRQLDSLTRILTPVDSFTCDLNQGMLLEDAFNPAFVNAYRNGLYPQQFAIYDTRLQRGNP